MAAKHHYVPQFYLKGFSDPSLKEPFLWVVDLDTQTVGRHSPKITAVLPGYYDVDLVGDEPVDNKSMFENMLSSVESKASTVIQRIRKQDFNLTIDDRVYLSGFIGLQLGRVPIYRDYISDELTKFYNQRLIDSVSDDVLLKQKYGDDADGYKAYLLSGRAKLVPKKDYLVSLTLKVGTDFAELMLDMTWAFLITNGKSKFFTSDNPAMLLSNNRNLKIEMGGDNKDLEIAFPISPSCVLLAHNHTNQHTISDVDSNTVDMMNWRSFRTVYRYIFCSTEIQADELLEAYNLAKWKGFPKEP